MISETDGIPLHPDREWPRLFTCRTSPRRGNFSRVVCQPGYRIVSLVVRKDDDGELYAEWIMQAEQPRHEIPLWRRLWRELCV